MIHPSYVDLMKVVNKDVEEGETPVINSRYSIVMATSKRARQIVDGDEPLVEDASGKKPLSVAIEELNEARIRILTEDEKTEVEEKIRLAKEAQEQLRAEMQAAAEARTDAAPAEKESEEEEAE